MNDMNISRDDRYSPPGDSATSVAFHSLVERSIAAWNSLNYVGVLTDKTITIDRHTQSLRRLNSMEALLENHLQFWFFQLRESFLQQKLMMKWDPTRLDDYILLPIDYGFANNEDCFFVSHYWHAREHPDPEGHDMRLFHEDLAQTEWSYIWVDWTCMPQAPRNKAQRAYFKKMLQCIPMLVRDCAFEWRFPAFEPRAWILFEVAEYILNHTTWTTTEDIAPFICHVDEMVDEGVHAVITKYKYACTNGADMPVVVGWLELLVILAKVVPEAGRRQEIFDYINRGYVGTLHETVSGLKIDKAKGEITCNEKTYTFTPVFLPTVD